MRKNSNYFGDVSQFFLKAKRKENFVLDPEVKKQLREKISLKINELKNPVEQKVREQAAQPAKIITDEPVKSTAGFWSIWKRQLISVPASLFALVMIVLAANNFNFSMQPKEDFSPKTGGSSDVQTSVLDTSVPEKTQDSARISETTTQTTGQKPDLLVLDINSMGKNDSGEIRTLNKNLQSAQSSDSSEKTASVQTQAQPQQTNQTTVQQPEPQKETYVSTAASQTTNTSNTTNTSATDTQTKAQNTTDVSSENTGAQNTQTDTESAQTLQQTPGEESSVKISEEVVPTQNTQPISENPLIMPSETLSTTNIAAQQITAPQETTNSTGIQLNSTLKANTTSTGNFTMQNYYSATVPLKDYIKDTNIFVTTEKTDKYTVNFYKSSSLKNEPVFNNTIITKITADKTPSAVNVYYIDNTEVLVEIIEGTTKRMYLYQLKDGAWTVIKYEKN